LDIHLTRSTNGAITKKVYRKPTHTGRYLNYKSYHHISQKMSVVDALAYRAIKICDEEFLEEELNHIRGQLRHNGFPIRFINSRIEMMKARVNQGKDEEEEVPRLILPFMGPLTTRLTTYLRRRLGCKFGFIPGRKIGSILSNAKEKPTDTPPGIYKIICSCKKIYVGETKRPYTVRID